MKYKVNDRRRWYREEYLKSDHWKDLKASKLSQSPQCFRCGSTAHLDVHHLRYKNIFDVTLSDLLTLCRSCHTKEHEHDGQFFNRRGLPKQRVIIDSHRSRWAQPSRKWGHVNKKINAIRHQILSRMLHT